MLATRWRLTVVAMRFAALVVMLAGTGCAGASGLAVANGLGLGVQTAALACDWQQTRRASEMGWRVGDKQLGEDNPVLGETPTPMAVDAYFLAAAVAAGLAWYALPRRLRLLAPLAVVALQASSIAHNVGGGGVDLGVCGLGDPSLTADRR